MCSNVIVSKMASSADLIAAALKLAAELTAQETPDSGAECMELAEGLVAVIDRCEAALTPLIDRVDASRQPRSAGYPSTQGWLRSACGMHGGRAHDRVTAARQLPRMKQVTDRFVRGDLPYGYVTVITNTVSRLNDNDATLAERLLLHRVDDGCTVRELTRYATRIHDHFARLDDGDPKPRRGYQRSWIQTSTSADGGAFIKGWLTPEDIALLHAALDPLTKPAGADDPRDHTERTADAFHTVLANGSRNWNATVIIDHEVIDSGRPGSAPAPGKGARFPDGTPIPPERARQLALNAGISALILGSSGLPLYLGRTSRLVSPGQRRALDALYATCAVKDCDIPAALCEIDHIIPWSSGGTTNINQLVPLCTFHNQYKAQHPSKMITSWHDNRWHYTIRHHRHHHDLTSISTLQAA
jgi:Domain of unknown function (DUF222)/HNH endonuclease